MNDDSAAPPSRVSPRKRNQSISVADITMLVRVPGKPTAIRAFTDDERELAAEYAAETGGEIVPLPLSPPAGYIPGPQGFPVPQS